MGILKLKDQVLDSKTSTIREVLRYFAFKEDQIPKATIDVIAASADNAYFDDILFEEFENWTKNHDDDSFLFLINHYWETANKPALSQSYRELTNQTAKIEAIKENSKKEVAKKFAQFLNKITHEHKLTTNEAIGNFLELTPQRVSILLKGEHRPQRGTIAKIAEKFQVPLEIIQKEITG
jgi:NADPH-dependent curcumin reductase CurA